MGPAIAPELIAGAPEMFAAGSGEVGQLVAGAGLNRQGVSALMEKSPNPDAFLRHLRALQPKPASPKALSTPKKATGSNLSRPSSRGTSSSRSLPVGLPRVPQSQRQANGMLARILLAGGLGLLVMEAASKFTGQYFRFDYNQVPAKAAEVFGAAAKDRRNTAPDRYAYQPLYKPTGAPVKPPGTYSAPLAPPPVSL